MAALILDLYRHGYRNFLFFVNSGQIIETTKENFLNPASAKHLIAPTDTRSR
jgi:type III restriction enzyme